MSSGTFQAELVQRDRFRFDLSFDKGSWAPIVVDEPEPIGSGAGPNPARMLAAAVGHCLAASLYLCIEKSRVSVEDLRVRVEGSMIRNETGRLRIDGLDVTITPTVEGEPSSRYDRCIDIFEDFCIVTQSVRRGIDVGVRVEPVFVQPVGASSPTSDDPGEDG